MTIEIKELIIQVRVKEEATPALSVTRANKQQLREKQQLLEELKQEILDYLSERGRL